MLETYLGPEFGDPVLSSRVVIASPYSGGGHGDRPLRVASAKREWDMHVRWRDRIAGRLPRESDRDGQC
jgi:hypothetical protein